jgi:hypothetical protein
MEEFDDQEIAKLLRLKRYEQPSPGYFENFLHEFHRRQRDELLREPLWRICLQRVQDFMLRLNVPALTSYPVAVTAVVICAAFITLRVSQTPVKPHVAAQPRAIFNVPVTTDGELSLDPSVAAARVFNTQPLRQSKENARTHRAAAPPRYVLDSVPVSYESTFKF